MNKHYLFKNLKKNHIYSFHNQTEIDLYINYNLNKFKYAKYCPVEESIVDAFIDFFKNIGCWSVKTLSKVIKLFKTNKYEAN